MNGVIEKTQEVVYCPTGEDSFLTLQEAFEFIESVADDYDDANGWVIEVCKKIPATHKEFVHGDGIAEYIAERAYDNYGEYAEDYLNELIGNKELQEQLESLIVGFIEKNAAQPTFFTVGECVDSIIVDDELLKQHGINF